jgi:hypothetical protein
VTTPAGDVGLSILRTVLEEHVSLEMAPKLLFAALSKLPPEADIPKVESEVRTFINGPLAQVLHEKLGAEEGGVVHASLIAALTKEAGTLPPPGSPEAEEEVWVDVSVPPSFGSERPPAFSESRPTLEVDINALRGQTAMLQIIARTTRLARWIRAAVGGGRVTTTVSTNLSESRERMKVLKPNIIIIDGQDPADVPPGQLAALLEQAPETALVILWASDQPGGSAAAASFETNGNRFVPVPRGAGFEPMLDYIRARVSG